MYNVWGFSGGLDDKESACNAGGPGSIPALGRSPGEGNGNLLQYSCLENFLWTFPMKILLRKNFLKELGGLQPVRLQSDTTERLTLNLNFLKNEVHLFQNRTRFAI